MSIKLSDAKSFLNDKINRVFIAVMFLCIINAGGIFYLNKQIENCTNKVHFRYYNLTKSLEDIYNIQIDTRDGRIIPHTINNR